MWTWIVVRLRSLFGLRKTIYVAPDGNDKNQGDRGAPKATIRAALALCGRGDTVYLLEGEYDIYEAITVAAGVPLRGEDVNVQFETE